MAKPTVGANVYDCDESHERRARLRPSPQGDPERMLLHDFRNGMAGLVLAAQYEDARLLEFYRDELTNLYREAIHGHSHQEKPQRAAA